MNRTNLIYLFKKGKRCMPERERIEEEGVAKKERREGKLGEER